MLKFLIGASVVFGIIMIPYIFGRLCIYIRIPCIEEYPENFVEYFLNGILVISVLAIIILTGIVCYLLGDIILSKI